jgi:hypothetical protein
VLSEIPPHHRAQHAIDKSLALFERCQREVKPTELSYDPRCVSTRQDNAALTRYSANSLDAQSQQPPIEIAHFSWPILDEG